MSDSYKVKLASAEGDVFEVDPEVAKQSTTIRNMLEDLGMDDDKDAEPIPLPNVNSAILRKVIQWGEYHRSDPTPIGSASGSAAAGGGGEDGGRGGGAAGGAGGSGEDVDKRSDAISQWDTEFLKVDQGTLFELILAANYLDIKQLLDLCCKSVANMIKGKSVEEIRKTFNIKNDFTPAEEEAVRKENEWCEDRDVEPQR